MSTEGEFVEKSFTANAVFCPQLPFRATGAPSACGVFRPEQSIGKLRGTSGERVGEYTSEGMQMFLESILAALPALMIPFKSPQLRKGGKSVMRYEFNPLNKAMIGALQDCLLSARPR
jgi:hypothetical protein